ncbi:hypothetical protein SLE2022_034660 [Rubroshorea leprosula]
MKLLLVLLLRQEYSAVSAMSKPFGPSISPVSLPALSPGIHMESREQKMDPSRKKFIALIGVCSSLVAIILVLFCLWIRYWKKSQKSGKNDAKNSDVERGLVLAPFLGNFRSLRTVSKKGYASFMDCKILEKATSKFHDSNVLGVGGFGRVYKARLEDGSCVAVKKLDCSTQDAGKEFENEVDLLSKFHHPNIISLVGYSIESETGFIVYELMNNGSLETQLHGPSNGSELSWYRRMKIALDTAKGLEYLHEHCNPVVIHRDLKSSNILLDSNFNAKLSDFGLAVIDGAQNKNDLKLSGTVGYVAPEYLLVGKLTDKSDVYAFGVVLLELLFGRKAVEKEAPAQCQTLVTWAMPKLTDRSLLPEILDPVIKNTMDLKHLFQVAAVALLCVQPEPSYRPLITDVMHSLTPLVPVELGGTLRQPSASSNPTLQCQH